MTTHEKNAATLDDSQSKFRRMIDCLPQLVWMSGTDGKCHYFNQQWLDFTGRTLLQEVGSGWHENVHPDDLPTRIETYNTAFARQDEFSLEYRLRRADGEYRWLLDRARPWFGDDGEFAGYVGSCADITDRRRATAALQQSEEKYRGFVENSNEGIYLYEFKNPIPTDLPEDEQIALIMRDGYVSTCNSVFASMYGFDSVEDVIGLTAAEAYQTDDNEANNDFLLSLIRSDYRISGAISEEFDADGNPVVFSNNCLGIVEDGCLIRVWGTQVDVTDKRRSELALQHSEQRYRSLVKASASTQWVTDPDGAFLTRQESWEAYTGAPWEEHKGWGWSEKIHPEDRGRLVNSWIAAVQDPPELFFDAARLWNAESQEYHHFEVRAVPIRDADGKLIEWIGTTTDIHKRRTAEAELRRSQIELSRAQQIAHMGNWEYQVSGDRLRWSDEVYRIFGLEVQCEEMTRKRVRSMVHPQDRDTRDAFLSKMLRAAPSDELPLLEFRVVRPDGTVRTVQIHAELIFEKSRLSRVVGTIQDITELKQTEMFLAGEKRILEQIATGAETVDVLNELVQFVESQSEGMVCSVLVLDRSGKKLLYGAAPSLPADYCQAVHGIEIGPGVGSCGTAAYLNEPVSVSDIENDPLWMDFKDVALKAGLQACWSVPLRSSGGDVLGTLAMYFHEKKSPTDQHKNLISRAEHLAAIVLEKDRTEENARLAQERLLKQEQQETARVTSELDRISKQLIQKTRFATIGELSAQIAHDLRNPLGAVRNAGFYLTGELKDSKPDLLEFLSVIDNEAATCDTIIRNLLEATSPREPERSVVDAAELIRNAIDRLNAPSGVSVELQATPDPYFLNFDPVQFRQMMDNLLSNAVQAVGVSGCVEVELTATENDDFVRVRDTGPGVSAEDRGKIFELLFTTKAKGTGLGLAICRDIVDRHGGTIQLKDSAQPGAEFVVQIAKNLETGKP